jgi:hypothetical protein
LLGQISPSQSIRVRARVMMPIAELQLDHSISGGHSRV